MKCTTMAYPPLINLKIPNYIFFYVEKINNMNDKMKNKGEFKLLNSLEPLRTFHQIY